MNNNLLQPHEDNKEHSTSIIKNCSTNSLPSLSSENNRKKIKKGDKKKIISYFCSIAFLFPFSLAVIASITFIIVFIVNYIVPNQTSKEMSGFLTTESINRIKERLDFITNIPPKIVTILNDINSYTLFINEDLQGLGKNIIKKLYINYPEITAINLVNDNNYEELFFERLPNGTIYEGYRYPNKYNDTNLYRYIVNNDIDLVRVEGWGPTVIVRNFIPVERDWYVECKEKINYWSKVVTYSTGRLALVRCSSFYSKLSKFLGIVTVDFTLGNLHVFLKSFIVGKTGLSFIMERNGNLIAASVGSEEQEEGNFNSRLNVVNSKVDTIKIVGTEILKEYSNINITTTAAKLIDVKGSLYFVEISEFYIHENINWLIIVAFPSTDYMKQMKLSTILTIVITFLMILVSVCISAIVSCCFIKKPLLQLRNLMKQVGFLKFDNILNEKYRKKLGGLLYEVKSIQLAFYSMVCTLQSFRKFVPEVIIKKSLEKNKTAKMYLVEREISILFMDFVEFTKLTVNLSPIMLIELMGEALEELSTIIEEEGGVIDKYIGDAIMALFNTPNPLPNYEEQACLSCLRCIQRLKDKEQDWNRRGLPSIKCRIGINSGKALIGNFGSSKRLNFTALGHNVNLAARLEPLCKLYQTNNLISESTFEKVKEKFCCKFIDFVVVAGTSDGVLVFTILNERSKATENELEMERITIKMKQYLQGNNLQKLKNYIKRALNVNGFTNDYALNFLLYRLKNSNSDNFIGKLTLNEKSF
ncbi:hypothetical protein ABK040_006011 [Willaertia magna]